MKYINCDKCSGKMFVDTTFMDNKNYELFCIMCGKRDFVGRDDYRHALIVASVKAAVL